MIGAISTLLDHNGHSIHSVNIIIQVIQYKVYHELCTYEPSPDVVASTSAL